MNKIRLFIYSAIALATPTLQAQDIALLSLSNGKKPSAPEDSAETSIPTIHNRDIPIRLFDIPTPSMPKGVHTLPRSGTSVNILSEWQVVLPLQEEAPPSPTVSYPMIYEKLIYNFPDVEISLPDVAEPTHTKIVFYPKRINPPHYILPHVPFSVVDLRSRRAPFMQYYPSVPKEKKESRDPLPLLSSVPSFGTPSFPFSTLKALPPPPVFALSYNLSDKPRVKDILCFPQIASRMDSLQEITLTDDLSIDSHTDVPAMDRWQPQWQIPTFTRAMSIPPEIFLPIVHTSISAYIPRDLHHHSMIELAVSRPMTFISPYPYMDNFALLPNLEELRTLSYRDEFISSTRAMPDNKGEYYFSITLTPNEHIAFPPIPQTVFFLIDRSSHISTEQFVSFQRGVVRSLPHLPRNSTFNIAFFDQKISLLYPMVLEMKPESIQKASAFVRSASKQLLFGSSNISAALHTLQKEIPSLAHTSYILLTNRKSLQSGRNAELLAHFIRNYRETCTLYIASVGDNSIEIPHVEDSLFSDTHAAFPRRLATLVKNISFPIANHLKISAITEDPNLHIELFPNSPILHQDKPFIIYGKMNHLKNFQLILQGNMVNSWINITKSIVFTTPTHSTKALAKHLHRLEKSHL